MPRSSRITVTGADRPGRVIVPSWEGKGRRTTTTVVTNATTRTTTRRAPTPTRLRRSARRRGTGGTLTGPADRPGDPGAGGRRARHERRGAGPHPARRLRRAARRRGRRAPVRPHRPALAAAVPGARAPHRRTRA